MRPFYLGLVAAAAAARADPRVAFAAAARDEAAFGELGVRAPPAPPVRRFLSATLGSNMVLQQAPQSAVLYGYVASGTVSVTFNGATIAAKVDANGTWRASLPPTEGSFTPHTITVAGSAGQSETLENVLFGDVYLCSGQSNMQFSMPAIANSSEEIALADKYPFIRLFTVGQKTSSPVPLMDLQTIEQNWSIASHSTIAGNGKFGYFSAVCWIFGREVFDGLGGKTPIGLINNNWGGTPVEHWTTPEALDKCEPGKKDSTLYNSMIHPYVVGPTQLTGFTWYQGEANTRPGGPQSYECTFPGMISAWREVFNQPDAYFGFIQLSTWCALPGTLIPEMRQAQMAALALPKVGYATNADHGAGCNIHPPPKQYCGKRLADSALALQYGKDVAWKSPSFKSQVASSSPPSVTVTLSDVSSGGLSANTFPFNYLGVGPTGTFGFDCAQEDGKTPGTCAWAAIQLGGNWVNATVTVGRDGQSVVLSAPPGASGTPTASSYAWGSVPMMSLYDRQTGLPVLGWIANVTTSGVGVQGVAQL